MSVSTGFKEQQRDYGFNTAGIEQMRQVASSSTSHAGFVTMLNDDGTASVVPMKEAIKQDNAIMTALQEEKAYMPCLACGTHPCPPGSYDLCYVSTAEQILNTKGAAYRTQIALDAWIAEHDHDPYNLYDESGSLVLN